MDLGWFDVCLKVKSAKTSREFYEKLGFHQVEGKDEEGWAVVTNGEARLGLYEEQHVGKDALTLNFRGGDVMANAKALQEKGLEFEMGPKEGKKGGGSAILRDPDGFSIFLDTAPGETKKE